MAELLPFCVATGDLLDEIDDPAPQLGIGNAHEGLGQRQAVGGSDKIGAPSKKNATGTCRIWEICCSRLAPIRFVPFSYFCTCWNVSDSASPSFSWLIPSIMRRILTRLPTCLSMGLGAFFVIYSVLLSFSPRFAPDATSKTGAIGDDPGRPYVQHTC